VIRLKRQKKIKFPGVQPFSLTDQKRSERTVSKYFFNHHVYINIYIYVYTHLTAEACSHKKNRLRHGLEKDENIFATTALYTPKRLYRNHTRQQIYGKEQGTLLATHPWWNYNLQS